MQSKVAGEVEGNRASANQCKPTRAHLAELPSGSTFWVPVLVSRLM